MEDKENPVDITKDIMDIISSRVCISTIKPEGGISHQLCEPTPEGKRRFNIYFYINPEKGEQYAKEYISEYILSHVREAITSMTPDGDGLIKDEK